MRRVSLGPLDARIVGGRDREGGGDGPVVVLLHGFGAPGDDLVALWRVLDVPAEVRFVFPEAPLQLPASMFGEARAWWMIDMERRERALERGELRDLSGEKPEGLGEARAKVVALLDRVQSELGVAGEHVLLGGFSQGAMLALDTALRTDRPLAGLALLSTTLLARDDWLPRFASRAGLPVLQSHGRNDPLLSFALAEELRDHLTSAGLQLEWIPFDGAHEIPVRVLQRLGPFISEALRATP